MHIFIGCVYVKPVRAPPTRAQPSPVIRSAKETLFGPGARRVAIRMRGAAHGYVKTCRRPNSVDASDLIDWTARKRDLTDQKIVRVNEQVRRVRE